MSLKIVFKNILLPKNSFMSLLAKILENLEKSMAAVSFAEAGEVETARQFFKPHKNAHKRVLLATDRGDINPKTLDYAMRLCQSIGGSLEICHVLHSSEESVAGEAGQKNRLVKAIRSLLREKGIIYQLVMGQECLAEEVLNFTKNRRDLLCVIFDAMEAGNSTCQQAREKMLAKFHVLHCPVVVYAEQSMA
ncbi:MAG: universal stress protein [Proteobacteria bacterium]|nr:universal stress protein [Pseudomonadota bacterium]MBU1649000.1 universal stress protein [Pseudomonadota bacterium]